MRQQFLIWAGVCIGILSSAVQAQSRLMVHVQDAQGRPLPGALVFLESEQAAREVRPMPDQELAQVNKAFVPQVLPITRGTAVHFPNRDTVRHHVYSFSQPKPFELKLYIGSPAKPVVFDQAGVVVIGCNIHDHMVAWILVLDTPYFALTDQQGRAELTLSPAPNYRLRAWHPRLPAGLSLPQRKLTMGKVEQSVTVRLTELEP